MEQSEKVVAAICGGLGAAALLRFLQRRLAAAGEPPAARPLEPRQYHPSDNASCAQQITESFFDDPIARTICPKDEEYNAATPTTNAWIVWALHGGFKMSEVVCDESGRVVCTALWEEAQMTMGMGLRCLPVVVLLGCRLRLRHSFMLASMVATLETKRHHHAPTAHHLQLLGTAPSMQSKGVGAKIIEVGIARAERQGVPCYLESSNPKNVPFYKRHGFVVVEELYPFEGRADGDGNAVKGKGPVCTLMLREVGCGKRVCG